MEMNNLQILPKDYRTVAAKAVKSYVKTHFNGLFSAEDIEDLVSDVVLRMWGAKDSFDPAKGKEFSWIWTIAKNVVKDAAEACHKRTSISGDMDETAIYKMETMVGTDDADKELLQDEFAEDLLGRLRLERDKRLLLYLMEDMEFEEMAKREGISVHAVYMAVFHLRQRLNNSAA